MTPRERILAVMNRRLPDRPPWLEIGFHTDIAGKLIGRELPRSNSGFHPDADLAVYEEELDGLIEAAQLVGLDAVWLKHWTLAGFAGEKGNAYDAGTIKTQQDWQEAVRSAPDERTHPWYRCVETFVRKVKKTDLAMGFQAALGFAGTWEAIGFRDFCLAVHENRELLVSVMEWFGGRHQQIVRDFRKYEPDLIVLGDDIAFGSGPVVSPGHFKEIFLPTMKLVAGESKWPWIYHSDGNLLPVMDDVLSLGMTGIHPIEPYGTMDIGEVKRLYGDRIVLAGNLDMNVIANGATEDIEREVRALFDTVGYDGRWILSSSNSIDSGANPENVLAMGKALKGLTY